MAFYGYITWKIFTRLLKDAILEILARLQKDEI
jgi:hypothetical protein